MAELTTYIYRRRQISTSARRPPDDVLVSRFSAIDGPLVSCLMVTRGDPRMVSSSLSSFRAQTYRNKELVLVCDSASPHLLDLLRGQHDVRLVVAGPGLTLGDLRNISVDEARGEIVCQWDDDDLYAPHRLEHGVGALLKTECAAVFLRQWMLWCPSQRLLALSTSRIWEGSMIAERTVVDRYGSLSRAEDTRLVEQIVPKVNVAIMDDPLSYCYCIHGQNTYSDDHMQRMIGNARLRLDYAPSLREFANEFRFAGHPAFQAHTARPRRGGGQRRRLQQELGRSQFMRRIKRQLGLWTR